MSDRMKIALLATGIVLVVLATATAFRAPSSARAGFFSDDGAGAVERVVERWAADAEGGPHEAPEAYRGLGTWVDIYDGAAFDAPEATVRAMAAAGVRTLYVETGNSGAPGAIHRPLAMARLLRAAHGRGMRVVAWYLPTLVDPALDYRRVSSAIAFRTSDGQRFDAFALDIESSKVASVAERNSTLISLSRRIRRLVGNDYPLGAIIPSPVGVSRNATYWPGFPYAQLARTYSVFLPMSYYTYHGDGASAADSDTRENMRILRAQEGCARVPVHLIGGLGDKSSVAEVTAFATAARDTQAAGVSLYDWSTTNAKTRAALRAWER